MLDDELKKYLKELDLEPIVERLEELDKPVTSMQDLPIQEKPKDEAEAVEHQLIKEQGFKSEEATQVKEESPPAEKPKQDKPLEAEPKKSVLSHPLRPHATRRSLTMSTFLGVVLGLAAAYAIHKISLDQQSVRLTTLVTDSKQLSIPEDYIALNEEDPVPSALDVNRDIEDGQVEEPSAVVVDTQQQDIPRDEIPNMDLGDSNEDQQVLEETLILPENPIPSSTQEMSEEQLLVSPVQEKSELPSNSDQNHSPLGISPELRSDPILKNFLSDILLTIEQRRELLKAIAQEIYDRMLQESEMHKELFDKELDILVSRFKAVDASTSLEIAKKILEWKAQAKDEHSSALQAAVDRVSASLKLDNLMDFAWHEVKDIALWQSQYEEFLQSLALADSCTELKQIAIDLSAWKEVLQSQPMAAAVLKADQKMQQATINFIKRCDDLLFSSADHLPFDQFNAENRASLIETLVLIKQWSPDLDEKKYINQFDLVASVNQKLHSQQIEEKEVSSSVEQEAAESQATEEYNLQEEQAS